VRDRHNTILNEQDQSFIKTKARERCPCKKTGGSLN